jgi:predicted nucleotidyltransferase
MTTILENHKEAIGKLSYKYSVQWLFAFGSDIRGDSRPRESDVDLLIEFAPISRRVKLHAFLICLTSQRVPVSKADVVWNESVRHAVMARETENTKRRDSASRNNCLPLWHHRHIRFNCINSNCRSLKLGGSLCPVGDQPARQHHCGPFCPRQSVASYPDPGLPRPFAFRLRGARSCSDGPSPAVPRGERPAQEAARLTRIGSAAPRRDGEQGHGR